MVYVEGLPSSRVPEEGGHNVEGIWRGESKYGHKIRKVSSTSIKIVRKAVKFFKGEMYRTGTHCRKAG